MGAEQAGQTGTQVGEDGPGRGRPAPLSWNLEVQAHSSATTYANSPSQPYRPYSPSVPREEGSVEAEVMVCNDLLCPVYVLPLALTKLSAS